MRTTIDVPKAVRDALGLGPGQELEITARDGRIEVDVPPVEMRLVDRDGLAVAVPDEPLPTITSDQVREVLERMRR
jgi:AbrB family looped-hinge helix DNA binding protein